MVGNLVVLSPHLDDAVLSIGGTISRLSRDHRVVVYDFFTLSDHTRSARFRSTLPVTLLRYTEELLASVIVRFTPKFFLLKDVTIRRKKDHFKVGMSLVSSLSRNIKRDRPTAIFCPLGVGEHPDHKSVFHALQNLIEAGIIPRHSVMYYEDMPYSSRTSAERRVEEISRLLNLQLVPVLTDISKVIHAKMQAVGVYRSQFHSKDREAILSYAARLGHSNGLFQPDGSYWERQWVAASRPRSQEIDRMPRLQPSLRKE